MSYLDIGYNNLLASSNIGSSVTSTINNDLITNISAQESVESAALSYNELAIKTMNVKEYIQSSNYVLGSEGWKIAGDGTTQFKDITLIGGIISYGKTSFTDSTNPGYYISSAGVYFGSAGDATSLKYTLSSGLLEITGRINATSGTIGGAFYVVNTTDNLQDAIDAVHAAGGGTINLTNGIHYPKANITLYSNTYLIGENSESTIIDFESAAYSVKIEGSNAYSTGTLSVSNRDTAVVGVGTTWTSAMVGRQILIKGIWYPIAAVTDTTHLTLGFYFVDTTVAGASYVIADYIEDAHMETLTIMNSTTYGFKANYTMELYIKDINIQSCGYGYYLENSSNTQIDSCDAIGNAYGIYADNVNLFAIGNSGSTLTSTGAGITLKNCNVVALTSSFILSSATDGIEITGCDKITIDGGSIKASGDNGIELVSGNTNIFINSVASHNNVGDGIKLTATSDRCLVSACSLETNGGYGVNVAAATCDNNDIRGNIYSGNVSGEWNDDGTDTLVDVEDNTTTTITLGENISTVPSPVYISQSDGKAYICDAGDTTKLDFAGFIITTGSANDIREIRTSGVVSGFSSLSAGSEYFVQNDGTIRAITELNADDEGGTYKILVGTAISSTEIFINKNILNYELVASDNLKISADTERTGTEAVYTKRKDIQIGDTGVIRVKFDLKAINLEADVYGKIYVNGAAVGTQRTNGTLFYVNYSEDISVSKGDLVQLYAKTSGIGGQSYGVRNFRIYYDKDYDLTSNKGNLINID